MGDREGGRICGDVKWERAGGKKRWANEAGRMTSRGTRSRPADRPAKRGEPAGGESTHPCWWGSSNWTAGSARRSIPASPCPSPFPWSSSRPPRCQRRDRHRNRRGVRRRPGAGGEGGGPPRRRRSSTRRGRRGRRVVVVVPLLARRRRRAAGVDAIDVAAGPTRGAGAAGGHRRRPSRRRRRRTTTNTEAPSARTTAPTASLHPLRRRATTGAP